MEKVNLADKFSRIDDAWQPRCVGELNGQVVKLAKLAGPFVWHQHADEDEMFLVVEGQLVVNLRTRDGERAVSLGAGEFLIVPRGVEHKPVAPDLALVMLFEPESTVNTGNVRNDLTVDSPEWL
jgi:mannose-6-phosphate isomerase-like protein (cupin superfamily)